ncbi:hypothetical protein L1987_32695 [Smallanthus sonchifolius]|uniref:Uncharacterized protein n=1 Tax=Smallanthus sonchifolius TaxID=185202 RepID=A0ACB9HNA9_9ASTR|nr:hypothetical protein L1987_32695 [Smallanthus sonchifolius]
MTKVVASLQAILELQLKSDNSAKSSGMMGFSWKIHKYRLAVTKQNSVPSNPYYVENVTPAPALVTDVADRLVNNTPKEHPTTREKSPTTMAELLASLEVPELEKESYDITMSSGIMSERNSIMFLEGVKAFTYDELNHATTNFQDTCLGKGIDREVYKGWVDNLTYSPCHQNSGLLVAVKRFNYCIYFDWQMLKECNHPNLVKLIGYCMEGEQLFLVYEFMNNGNLDDLLCRGVVARLPLVKKVQIAFGVARGILFLQKMHCYFGTDQMINPMFERRDIMLDKDFMAKLSDYGVLNYRTLYELYLKLKPMFERPREGRKIKKDTDMISDYVVACESSRSPPRELLRMDLSGFTMILAEHVMSRHYAQQHWKIVTMRHSTQQLWMSVRMRHSTQKL